MEPRPDEPDMAQIIRALEQRVAYLERAEQAYSQYRITERSEAELHGRLLEARDHLENIRIMARPSVVETKT